MQKIHLIFLLIIQSFIAFGQRSPEKFKKLNSIQLELSGGRDTFIPYSLNYERVVYQTNKLAWNVKLGGTYRIWRNHHQKAAILEIGAIGLTSKHHFEFGLFTMLQDGIRYFDDPTYGPSFPSYGVRNPPFYTAIRIGYRLQLPEGKWLFRAGLLQPILMHTGNERADGYKIKFAYRNGLILWPVVSVGRAF